MKKITFIIVFILVMTFTLQAGFLDKFKKPTPTPTTTPTPVPSKVQKLYNELSELYQNSFRSEHTQRLINELLENYADEYIDDRYCKFKMLVGPVVLDMCAVGSFHNKDYEKMIYFYEQMYELYPEEQIYGPYDIPCDSEAGYGGPAGAHGLRMKAMFLSGSSARYSGGSRFIDYDESIKTSLLMIEKYRGIRSRCLEGCWTYDRIGLRNILYCLDEGGYNMRERESIVMEILDKMDNPTESAHLLLQLAEWSEGAKAREYYMKVINEHGEVFKMDDAGYDETRVYAIEAYIGLKNDLEREELVMGIKKTIEGYKQHNIAYWKYFKKYIDNLIIQGFGSDFAREVDSESVDAIEKEKEEKRIMYKAAEPTGPELIAKAQEYKDSINRFKYSRLTENRINKQAMDAAARLHSAFNFYWIEKGGVKYQNDIERLIPDYIDEIPYEPYKESNKILVIQGKENIDWRFPLRSLSKYITDEGGWLYFTGSKTVYVNVQGRDSTGKPYCLHAYGGADSRDWSAHTLKPAKTQEPTPTVVYYELVIPLRPE